MALFKIFKGSDSTKLTNPQAIGYKVPVDGYAYYDTSTKLFYIDADYSSNNNGTISRQPINAYKADIATLANAAVYETGPNQNDPLHKINEYYGHELTFSNHTLSLMAGDGITTLGSTVGLVSKSSDGFAPQLPNENEYNKFFRQDGNWAAPGIPFAAVDATSTATKFTATVPGITELRDGTAVLLYNGKVTSTTNYTIDINGLGAYGTYSNMSLGNNVTPTSATRDTTIFNINYAMLFVFCTTIHGVGSGWICYRGYDANTNTIGYQIRTNSFSLPMTSVVYRYRLLFQSADNNHWVPATNSTSTKATSSRTVCQDPINPLGAIVYYGSTSSVSAGSRPSASNLWQQYTLNLGYSFQKSTNYSLTSWKPVYVKCALQSNGSAIIDSDDPIVQDLPSSDDGNLYILLGYAYSATSIELVYYHPVYYYKDGLVRVWAGANIPTKTSDLTNDSGFATTDYVDSIVSNFSGPMVFKGSLGTGGTITTLPAASSSNVGFTYKVITDGTYASQLAKAGDTFISDGTNWILIPSGDEPSGTVTSVGVSNATNGGLSISGSPITSSGTISIGHSNVLSNAQTTQAVYPIKIDKNGHISAYGTAVSIPTKVSDLDNDSEFVNSSEAAAAAPVQSVNGQTGTVSLSIPSKTSDLANDSNFITGMTILSYGHSTWNDFLTAYNADKVVYCRASSNSNPATGTQGRMAFMAYIGFSGSNPTNVEFQYYRSVSTHTDSQQGDQVYIYKLESNGTWSVTVREAYTKISPSSGLSKSYSSGVLTVTHATPTGASSGTKGSLDNTNLEFIQTISTDDYGHVIGHTTRSLPIYDGTAT